MGYACLPILVANITIASTISCLVPSLFPGAYFFKKCVILPKPQRLGTRQWYVVTLKPLGGR